MLGVIANKFSIGKETYHPYSAELHYFRIDKRYWSICFERIKKAGFKIISTTVPWNIHQVDSQHIDFSGYDDPRKDLIVFLELAREFGFKVILRPGPWVAGQVPFGGLPRFIFNDIKVFARDSEGGELELPSDFGVDGGYLPSYLHSNFQYYLKAFFKSFIETTKNYVHPRGPVFMVELDYETSFGHLLDPAKADYNPDVVARYWPEFLEQKYGDVKSLNSRYKEKNKDLNLIEPPRKFTNVEFKHYPKIIDWFEFREFMLHTYLDVLEDVFKSYTVEPLLFRSLYFPPASILPAYNLVPEDRFPFLGTNVFPEGSYFDLSNKARFMKAEYGFAYAASFTSGRAAIDPDREEAMAPISLGRRRFYFAAGLASGFKGFNHYMFVDRDRWYGAPLHKDGTVSDGFQVVRNFNSTLATIGYESMESKPKLAVVGNRLYDWLRLTSSKKEFQYLDRLMDQSTVGFCRDMMRLRIDYGIRENRTYETMDHYKVLFVPTTEVMARRDQEGLIELAKGGVTIILCGVMPKQDENFKDCQILANHFRLKTTVDCRIGAISHKHGEFTSHIYANIKSTDDSKVKKLATCGTKLVAVCSSKCKGRLYLLTFDVASGGHRQKLAFIESIIQHEEIFSHVECSDPSVDISFQMGEKKGLLTIVVPPPGDLSDGFEGQDKEIIIQADLKPLGFSSPNVKLINLFDDEEAKPIRTTLKDLKTGISMKVQYPDGFVFVVQKR